MLVAQYIAKFIKEKGTSQAFGYPGGMITFLMDAFEELTDFKSYSLYHEQSAAFAACAYSQSSNLLGVAYATSGPGVTNLVTGIAHAYYESIPILFITGQVNTKDSKGDLKIRQKGFQETDVVSLVSSITKYATYISSAEDIKFELEKPIKSTGQIADCYFIFEEQIYIIEVQRSNQSYNKYNLYSLVKVAKLF
jgi:acetolactate synthase-1/2/3 large subunit